MHLFESFIRNPVKVSVGILIVALFGAISLVTMPKELIPAVQNPVLSVETNWPGASPQEIEREIVQEQEEQLAAVEGLVKMSSTCRTGSADITLEFAVGTDISQAMMLVNTRLQQVREYPINAEEPVIEASSSADSPIARFALTARPPSADVIRAFQAEHPELEAALEPIRKTQNTALRVFRLRQLYDQSKDEHPELAQLLPPEVDLQDVRKISEDIVEPQLERVPGVAEADTYGGQDEELQVIVDPVRLAARQLTIADVRNALTGANKDTSAGDLWESKRRWVIRTLGQFRDPEHVKRQILTSENGQPVYVGDVADVQVAYKKLDSLSRRYGLTTNGLSVRRSSNSNVLEVMEGIYDTTEQLNNGVLKRLDLELFQYYDETEYIRSAIRLVQQNIFVGGALTIIVLMLFLHLGRATLLSVPLIAASSLASIWISPWFVLLTIALILICGLWFGRGALVVGLAIPASVIGTFLLMGLCGRSLNVISLAGLAFAVGMLVDNAVVVLENIYRKREQGEDAFTAAAQGTAEVAGAVVASTLTTIAVFVPVLFVQDTSGQLFKDIALAISFAVGLSLLISFTMIPAAAARLFRLPLRENGPGKDQSETAPSQDGPLSRWILTAGTSLATKITQINRWLLERRHRSVALICGMVVFSVGVSYALWPKVEYLPSGNRNFVFCSLSPPPGHNMDYLTEMGERLETDLKPYWDVDPGSPEAEALDYPTIDYYFYAVFGTRVFLGVRATDENRVQELIPLVQDVASQFPGTRGLTKQSSLFERGLSAGRTIDIEITGGDLNSLYALGKRILNRFEPDEASGAESVIPGAQASPQPSLDLESPEIHIEPKLFKSSEMSYSAADLGYTVDAYIDGAYAGDYFVDGDKIDLTIRGPETYAANTQDIGAFPIATPDGDIVRLDNLAKVTYSSGPEAILRRERLRAINISVTPPLTMPLEEAMLIIESEVISPLQAEGVLDGETMVNLSGTADKLRQAWDALRWNLILALAITYLLMAALFESWLYPFVIIFTVPLGAVGGILGLALLNQFVFQALDVITMLGFIILIGTVVNNAILIVHQSLNYIRQGMPPREAVPESVRTRIRPIFITTTTTVLGLLPLVLVPGAGSELYRGLGAVVLGGLVFSTAFTLFLVPTVFILTLDAKQWLVGQLFGKTVQTPPPTQSELAA